VSEAFPVWKAIGLAYVAFGLVVVAVALLDIRPADVPPT